MKLIEIVSHQYKNEIKTEVIEVGKERFDSITEITIATIFTNWFLRRILNILRKIGSNLRNTMTSIYTWLNREGDNCVHN